MKILIISLSKRDKDKFPIVRARRRLLVGDPIVMRGGAFA